MWMRRVNILFQMLLYDNTVDVNILKPRKHGRHIADGIFNRIFLIENISILIEFSPKFFCESNSQQAIILVAWQQAFIRTNNDDLVYGPICVTRPRWVNSSPPGQDDRQSVDCIFKCIFMNESV